MNVKSIYIKLSSLIVVLFILSGCSFVTRPTIQNNTLPITVINFHPDKYNMPVTASVINNSSIVVRKVSNKNIGYTIEQVALNSGIFAEKAKRQSIQDINSLKNINIYQITKNTLQKMQSKNRLQSKLRYYKNNINKQHYEARPYLYYQFDDAGNKELSVILRVVLIGDNTNVKWTGQYVRAINIRSIINNKSFLRNEIQTALERTIYVFLQDLNGKLNTKSSKDGVFYLTNYRLYMDGNRGYIISKKNNYAIYQGGQVTVPYGGVHILDKGTIREYK